MKTTHALTLLLALALFGLVLLTLAPAARAAPTIVRVTTTGTTTWPCGDLSNWSNPCALQTALTNTVTGSELWVVAGTYLPTGITRTATFQLRPGVALYGGFAGGETLRTQRNFTAHVTILSGDIGMVGDASDNAYHVVTGSGVTNTAVLDGFTVTGGKADGSYPDNQGGGMFNNGGTATLTNVTFISNSSAFSGGGMFNNGGSPTLTNVTFSGNSASELGGGMVNYSSSPTLTNVTFISNTAFEGGGLRNDTSNPTLANVTFSNNSATYGGAMDNAGSSPTLTNITFSGNTASSDGGGMYNNGSSPTIRNTIFWGNTATNGAQIYDSSSTPTLSDSVVQGGYAGGTHIISANPLLGAVGNYGGSTQTIPLLYGSSAIDAGDDAVCPDFDQRGVPRPQGAHCDIGAFESIWVYLPLIRK